MKITKLYLFPVKSCGGIAMERLTCTATGALFDRDWMIVDEAGKFVTQREHPRLALVQTGLDVEAGLLRLSAPGLETLEIEIGYPGDARDFEIWGQPTPAHDCGAAAATWLSAFAARPLRLVRTTAAGRERTGEDPRTIRFTDSYPLHFATLATLADLNRRLAAPVEMLRFRPNIVIDGTEAWAEDSWRSLRAGGTEFRFGKRAERCTITTVNPESGERGHEPLKTLAGFRKNARNRIEFGQYLHSVPGAELRIGMTIEPLTR